jgi:uncharacterized membrane protein YeaQ/YmgE (transglycosylase-associated protein family)
MLFTALIGLVLAAAVGWLAGWLLHRRVRVLPDTLQGVCGAALCMEVYALTGPIQRGELLVIAFVGAWVSVGVAHATAVLVSRRPARAK